MITKVSAILVAAMLVCGVAIGATVSGVADIDNIKASEETVRDAKLYNIPLKATLQKTDGSGTVEVVVQVLKMTKVQLQRSIEQANAQIAKQQAVVAELQAQLDKITELEK